MTRTRVTRIGGPTTLIEIGGWGLLTDPTFDPPGWRYRFGWGTSSRKVVGPAVAAADLPPIDAGRHRLALVCDGDSDSDSDSDVRARLGAFAVAGRPPAGPGVSTGTVRSRPRLVFLFPGQGSQRPGMAAGLYATAPVFRDTLDEASAHFGPLHGRTLTDWCTDPGVDPADLARTEVTQPVAGRHPRPAPRTAPGATPAPTPRARHVRPAGLRRRAPDRRTPDRNSPDRRPLPRPAPSAAPGRTAREP
ncbi:acyltransferase domain-containing protein [Streptomyces sp. NBC_01803]|uniref:acyltransferase domain-containing protein n=1 Tax=Streptomyces sp. NBC_01803 TaxID=2975946 RepID=UPI002DD81795|nr:acyltransferase domain-containing protein [Streptomyces sp. NBC_01803]WSA42795.1 acyltransferase domain-containing protein [Streptomyces sp. NBC_01803]